MKYAAIQALQGEPVESSDEEVLAPKITSRYRFYSSPSSTIYMSIDKAENTTVRYTEDGTDPDVSSTKGGNQFCIILQQYSGIQRSTFCSL